MGSHLLVQLSDLHLTSAKRLRAGAEPATGLAVALAAIEGHALRPDVVLVSGDIADRGEASCYRELADLLASSPALAGALVVATPGNHDRRSAMREHLLARLPGGTGATGTGDEPLNSVALHGGLRIIALDSTIPGEDAGALAPATLRFLRDELTRPAREGTILMLHHPPIDSPIEPMARLGLREPEALADAIGASDVRLITCGHAHHRCQGMLGAVPVLVAPATAYLADPLSAREFRPVSGAGLTRIDVREQGIVASMVPLQVPAWLDHAGPA